MSKAPEKSKSGAKTAIDPIPLRFQLQPECAVQTEFFHRPHRRNIQCVVSAVTFQAVQRRYSVFTFLKDQLTDFKRMHEVDTLGPSALLL